MLSYNYNNGRLLCLTHLPIQKKLQQLKAMVGEITHCYSRMDSEREQVKEIVKAASDTFGIKKVMVTKIARTMYKHNYADVQAEHEEFELLYESVVDPSNP